MAEVSAIAWTNSTFNPWIGCTKVGPGCDNCYAENLDSRKRWGGVIHWGAGTPRHRTSVSNWKQPLAWNKKAAAEGRTHRVFCASLADVFDNEVSQEWRNDLWELIWNTPALTWLLLTKRIGNAATMLPFTTLRNVWIGATIVNQDEWDRDREKLFATPAAVRFVSYEPAQGPVTWGPKMPDWIIIGGESGSHAREFHVDWARNTINECRAFGVAPFVKQLGANIAHHGCTGPYEHWPSGTRHEDTGRGYFRYYMKDRAGADLNEWPEDLRVQEFPLSPDTREG